MKFAINNDHKKKTLIRLLYSRQVNPVISDDWTILFIEFISPSYQR